MLRASVVGHLNAKNAYAGRKRRNGPPKRRAFPDRYVSTCDGAHVVNSISGGKPPVPQPEISYFFEKFIEKFEKLK